MSLFRGSRSFPSTTRTSCYFKAPMPRVWCSLGSSHPRRDGVIPSSPTTHNQADTTHGTMGQARNNMDPFQRERLALTRFFHMKDYCASFGYVMLQFSLGYVCLHDSPDDLVVFALYLQAYILPPHDY